MGESGWVTRGLVFPLDVSPSEERLLVSYCAARRFAYNWVLGLVSENLAARRAERAAGVAEDRLTPALSWSYYSLTKQWNSVKDEVAPWWREVSMHAFRSGIADAATALKNWSESRSGKRKGPKMGHSLLALDPFFPSSKTCSNCRHAKAKLALSERIFRCDHCGFTADRDVNAARTIHHEASRLLDQQFQQDGQTVAGLRPETQNADRRRRKTSEAQADLAAVA